MGSVDFRFRRFELGPAGFDVGWDWLLCLSVKLEYPRTTNKYSHNRIWIVLVLVTVPKRKIININH
jgi:hypothetical protein